MVALAKSIARLDHPSNDKKAPLGARLANAGGWQARPIRLSTTTLVGPVTRFVIANNATKSIVDKWWGANEPTLRGS